MKRYLPLAVTLVLLASAGVVHGLWTNRWGLPPDIEAAAARLQAIPTTVGEWTSTEVPIDERQLILAEAVGHLSRRYERTIEQQNGPPVTQAVNVMVLCGPTGPMSVHPPTVCFTSAGLEQTYAERRMEVLPKDKSQPDTFFETEFVRSAAAAPLRMQTLWSWSPGDRWQAAGNPRFAFARAPFLYKIYVTRETLNRAADEPQSSDQSDPSIKFLEVFLPELNKAIAAR
jgi:hypothetical protein